MNWIPRVVWKRKMCGIAVTIFKVAESGGGRHQEGKQEGRRGKEIGS